MSGPGDRLRTPPDASEIELVAFDLDNTLYDEGLYYEAAFRRLVPVLSERSGHAAPQILGRLREILAEKGKHYHFLFSDLLAEIGLNPKDDLFWVLDGFRSVEDPLEPFTGVRELLRDLRGRYRLGLITSGMQRVQEKKLRLLALGDVFDAVVFSSSLPENKPGPMPFRVLLERVGVEPSRAVYVGDNPLFDFRAPNQLGMWSVRVRNPEFDGQSFPPADDAPWKVERVTDLRAFLLSTAPFGEP